MSVDLGPKGGPLKNASDGVAHPPVNTGGYTGKEVEM